jgi:hypothetical protein
MKNQKKTQYKNSWHKTNSIATQEYFETDAVPVDYKGYLIYNRIDTGYTVFDIVINGVCVSQCNGLNGAKREVDRRISPEEFKGYI